MHTDSLEDLLKIKFQAKLVKETLEKLDELHRYENQQKQRTRTLKRPR